MISVVLSMPTDFESLVPWLEQQVVGTRLQQLVGELRVVHGPGNQNQLETICGNDLSAVLESGLSVLDTSQISGILRSPQALLELQEAAFISGSPFWEQLAAGGEAGRRAHHLHTEVLRKLKPFGHDTAQGFADQTSSDLTARVERLKKKRAKLNQPTDFLLMVSDPDVDVPAQEVTKPQVTPADAESTSGTPSRRSWRKMMISVTAAAALMIAAVVTFQMSTGPTGWGFNNPQALVFNEGGEAAFLSHLAEMGSQWSNQTPASPAELETRLTQFSNGCQTLIDALQADGSLPQLSPENQEWLLDRCQLWKDRIDAHAVAVRQNPDQFEAIRKEADETVDTLVKALQERARGVA